MRRYMAFGMNDFRQGGWLSHCFFGLFVFPRRRKGRKTKKTASTSGASRGDTGPDIGAPWCGTISSPP